MFYISGKHPVIWETYFLWNSKLMNDSWGFFRFIRRLQYGLTLKVTDVCAQSCLTICDPMDCSLPGSSIHGIFPGKNTELVASCMLTLRVDDYWFLVFRFKIPNDSWNIFYKALLHKLSQLNLKNNHWASY